MRLVLELGLEHPLGVDGVGVGLVAVVGDCVNVGYVVSVDAEELFDLESLISERFLKLKLILLGMRMEDVLQGWYLGGLDGGGGL